jgi:quaternary ammonium compound-resistance protein SugE
MSALVRIPDSIRTSREVRKVPRRDMRADLHPISARVNRWNCGPKFWCTTAERNSQGRSIRLRLSCFDHLTYSVFMAWLFILLADVFEVAWPFMLKWSAALSKWSPALVAVFFMPAVFLLGEAVKRLPAATVYATFVGVGIVGTAVVGMVFFHESTNLGRVFSLVLIVLGVIGLRLFSGAPE